MQGKFITFEGCDGSGKSTQARRMVAYLQQIGLDVVHTREPGGSPGAEEIRSLILTGSADRWSAETELLLFNAARRDHVERTIRPALERGAIVICDRYADSTRVYQGVARADLRPLVDKLHELMIGLEPDITILMDIDPAESLRRGLARNGTEERFESMGTDFQRAIHAGFSKLEEEFPERVVRVSGEGSEDVVFERLKETMLGLLESYLNADANISMP